MKKIVTVSFVLAFLGIAFEQLARAQTHQGGNQGITQQTYVSHPDATLSAAAAPAALPTSAAPNKIVYWLCQNTGTANTARVGDASVGANQGIVLPTSGGPIPIPANNAILYGYSASGTTAHCDEVDLP